MTLKLNQVLAIEKGEKSRSYSVLTQLHKKSQKDELYKGFSKTYVPKDEEGDRHPDQSKKVQITASQVFDQVQGALNELWDIEATKDWANTTAKADVVVDGATVLTGAPPTFLLFLEKQLSDLYTFVDKLPVRDTGKDWTFDADSGLAKAAPVETIKTAKSEEPQVVIAPTEHHPGQWTTLTKDVTVGYWTTIAQSGAISTTRKATLLSRITKLSKAVKQAREEANNTECEKLKVADSIFTHLFKE